MKLYLHAISTGSGVGVHSADGERAAYVAEYFPFRVRSVSPVDGGGEVCLGCRRSAIDETGDVSTERHAMSRLDILAGTTDGAHAAQGAADAFCNPQLFVSTEGDCAGSCVRRGQSNGAHHAVRCNPGNAVRVPLRKPDGAVGTGGYPVLVSLDLHWIFGHLARGCDLGDGPERRIFEKPDIAVWAGDNRAWV